jgi:ABC-type dipeptide/oligopeptide/nickel transport system permease component
MILPALALGMRSIAFLARVTRSSMLDSLSADYLRNPRAKLQGDRTVVLRHALRNSLIPIITVLGLDLGAYLTGSILT